jgi:hypothetical protein
MIALFSPQFLEIRITSMSSCLDGNTGQAQDKRSQLSQYATEHHEKMSGGQAWL